MTQMKTELLYGDVDLDRMTFDEMRVFMEKAQQEACELVAGTPQNFRFHQFSEYDEWGEGYNNMLQVFFDRPETDKERKERKVKEEKARVQKEKRRVQKEKRKALQDQHDLWSARQKEAAERAEYERLKAKFEGGV